MENYGSKEHFEKGVTLALSGYQLIEAAIKLYLRNYFKIAKYLISEQVYFGFDGSDYDNAPLGKLINIFSKTFSDKELVSDLKSEISHRNNIAHQAALELFRKESLSSEEFNELSNNIEIHSKNITNLLSRLKVVNQQLKSKLND